MAAGDHVIFINGRANCSCHQNADVLSVYDFIDGMNLPDAISITVTESFKPKGKYLTHESIEILAALNISARKKATHIFITMDRSAYGVVFVKVITERNSFLSVVGRLLMQLRDSVTASEAYAIHQAIKMVQRWADMGDNPPEHDRLRELIKYAIDHAYRNTP